MGKKHKHKKQLKSEKAKIKLKGSKTKFLPKGQNVTEVSFKIKPIVIQQQLQSKTSNEFLSTRRLNVKDILNRLKHHNNTMKYENCQQLRELICSSSPDFLQLHLAYILEGTCPLILDREKRVRSEALKMLRAVLTIATLHNIESFFGILSTFLRCCMTHIDYTIQEDSLTFLDSLLECVPLLVARNADIILPNFFTLISKLKSNSTPGRTLTENLQSKYTAVRWRIKVLSRLKCIFEAMFSEKNNLAIRSKHDIICTNTQETNIAPLYEDKYKPCSINFFTDMQPDVSKISDEPLSTYIDTLMPLLYETWLEVAPCIEKKNKIEGVMSNTVVNAETASSLNCILNIIYLLWKLTGISEQHKITSTLKTKFQSQLSLKLLNMILKSFPYIRSKLLKQEKRDNSDNDTDTKCIKENLLLCLLFCVINKKLHDRINAEIILNYLNYCFLNRNYVGSENMSLLFEILKVLYLENLKFWEKRLDLTEFMENTLHFYKYNKISKQDKTDLFLMLCEIIQHSTVLSYKFQDLSEISSQLLLESNISDKALDSLLLLSKKNTASIQESICNNFANILANITMIEVTGIDNKNMAVIKILSIFYYTVLSKEHIELLNTFACKHPNYSNIIKHIELKNQSISVN